MLNICILKQKQQLIFSYIFPSEIIFFCMTSHEINLFVLQVISSLRIKFIKEQERFFHRYSIQFHMQKFVVSFAEVNYFSRLF